MRILEALLQGEMPVAVMKVYRSVQVDPVPGFPRSFRISLLDKLVTSTQFEIGVHFPAQSRPELVSAKGSKVVAQAALALREEMDTLHDLLVKRDADAPAKIVVHGIHCSLRPG